MNYKLLGNSGLRIPVLSLGTATFGGTNEFFRRWGTTDVKEAVRMVDLSLDHGMNFFDTANVYSQGASEEILGTALAGKRSRSIISTKGSFSMGDGINDRGASRHHIINQVHESLRRLKTDYIDVYFIHGFDSRTPMEETLLTLDSLVKNGLIRYIGCSNFAAWQLMKSLSISERLRITSYVVYQGYYSLIGRDYEQELMPMMVDQNIGLMVWSPLGWGRLTGKIKPGNPLPEGRIKEGGSEGGPRVTDGHFARVLNALEVVAAETGRSVPQIALNWLLNKRTVCNVVVGARNEKQLTDNIGSVEFQLSHDQLEYLDSSSDQDVIYPHWVGER